MKDERQIEEEFIEFLVSEQKYIYRKDIKDRATLEANFKNHFDCPYLKELPLKAVFEIIKDNLKNLKELM